MRTEEARLLSPEAVAALLAWYERNRRDLPWRRTGDPYRIWISEIMLQQTRVEAVRRYYERFLTAFPDVETLAGAPEEQLFKLWEGLGYYSRARNLQKAARVIVSEYGGHFPADAERLKKLPGVGDYTAGAIASIAFGLPEPAVDGNLLRVLSRVDGCFDDIMSGAVKKTWAERLRSSVPEQPKDAATFTQAMIELGATVCVPNGEAKCPDCPFLPWCRAAKEGLTEVLPVKGEKKPRRIEEKTVFLPLGERSFAVWSCAKNRWVVEEGEYELCVGASCRDLRLVHTVHVAGEAPFDEYAAPEFDVYRRADVQHVSDESFAALLVHDIPPARWEERGAVDFNDAISRGKYLPGGLGKGLYNALEAARRVMNLVGSKENAGNLMYVLDMPWRNAARMANVFSDDQIKALLKVVNKEKNGWKHFLAETKKKRAHKRA